jgi:hypothetical protein
LAAGAQADSEEKRFPPYPFPPFRGIHIFERGRQSLLLPDGRPLLLFSPCSCILVVVAAAGAAPSLACWGGGWGALWSAFPLPLPDRTHLHCAGWTRPHDGNAAPASPTDPAKVSSSRGLTTSPWLGTGTGTCPPPPPSPPPPPGWPIGIINSSSSKSPRPWPCIPLQRLLILYSSPGWRST